MTARRLRRLVRVALASVPILLLFGAALGFELQRSPRAAPLGVGLPCLLLEPIAPVSLPGGAIPRLFADGDATATRRPAVIWYVTQGRDRIAAHRVRIESGRAAVTSIALDRAGVPPSVYDVGTWRDGRTALFAMRQRPKSVVVRVLSLGRKPQVVASGAAPESRPPRGVRRDFFVGRLTPPLPDLFVIDRGVDDPAVFLSVYSGESGFEKALISDRKMGVAGVAPPRWSLDVARVEGNKPDVVVLREARGSFFGRPEAHVVPAADDFRQVATHATLPAAVARSRRFVVASSPYGPAVYTLTREGRRYLLRAVPLGAPVSSPDCYR